MLFDERWYNAPRHRRVVLAKINLLGRQMIDNRNGIGFDVAGAKAQSITALRAYKGFAPMGLRSNRCAATADRHQVRVRDQEVHAWRSCRTAGVLSLHCRRHFATEMHPGGGHFGLDFRGCVHVDDQW